MTNSFSQRVSENLSFSREEALRLSSGAIRPEHIVLGMLRDKQSPLKALLTGANIDVDKVKLQLEKNIQEDNSAAASSDNGNISLDEHANNILKLSILEARLQHSKEVDVEHIILAILHDKMASGAKSVLLENGLTYEKAMNFLMQTNSNVKNGVGLSDDDDNLVSHDNFSSHNNKKQSATSDTTNMGGGTDKTPVLDKFSTDLTLAAVQGKLDLVIGRDKEIQRVTEILCRRKKNNPILIGEPGVGKSAIAEGLAQRMAAGFALPKARELAALDCPGAPLDPTHISAAIQQAHLPSRYDIYRSRNEVSRTVRGAHPGIAARVGTESRHHCLHRRNTYYNRCR